MKKIGLAVLIGATILLSAFTVYNAATDWQITDGYSIKFKGTDAEGIFKTIDGTISFSENELANSKFSLSIDVTSINTGNGMKNKHAKSEKWFDAKQYPSITFTSSKFSKSGAGYQVDGTLDMHGVKKQIAIPFTFSANTFKANFTVNRLDYGVGTMEGSSKKVSNEINLEISIPVTEK